MTDAAIEQQPLVKAAQAAQFPRRRTGIDIVIPQMLEKAGHVLLRGIEQHRVLDFKEFRERSQVAEVGFARERPQTFLHAQIGLVVLEQHQVGGRVHTTIMWVPPPVLSYLPGIPYLVHQGIKFATE